MPATSGVATPILHYRTKTFSGIAIIRNLPEAATQTFQIGTPLQVSAGYLQACATINSVATALIAGFSTVFAANLTTAGVPRVLGTQGGIQNQPAAVIQYIGAPPNDGTTQVLLPDQAQTFQGILGNSATDTNAVLAQSMVGTTLGLTKDAGNGFWYVDQNITTAATGGCLIITSLIDPVGTLHGRVEFQVAPAAVQL